MCVRKIPSTFDNSVNAWDCHLNIMSKRRKRTRFKRAVFSSNDLFLIIIGAFGALLILAKIGAYFPHVSISILFVQILVFLATIGIVFFGGLAIARLILKVLKQIEEQRRYEGLYLVNQVNNMDHYEFEKFAAYVLKKNGFANMEPTQAGADGGIDGVGMKDGKKVLVQVKHYASGNDVGRPELQKFVGAFNHLAEEGWFITTSDFNLNSKEYAAAFSNLVLIDRAGFGVMMAKLGDDHTVIDRFMPSPLAVRQEARISNKSEEQGS